MGTSVSPCPQHRAVPSHNLAVAVAFYGGAAGGGGSSGGGGGGVVGGGGAALFARRGRGRGEAARTLGVAAQAELESRS